MNYKTLFLMGMVAAAGCSTAPAKDVVLDLPVVLQKSCIPLKTNVYAYTVNGRSYWTEGPQESRVSVPLDATSIHVNCEETGTRPKGCENSGFITLFMKSQPFLVDLHGSSHYELECRIEGNEMRIFVTKPYQAELKPVPRLDTP